MSTSRDKDVFVHMDSIITKKSGWKCLYTGEYVSYTPITDETGREKAEHVTGVGGNALLVDFGVLEFRRYYKFQFESKTGDGADSIVHDRPSSTTIDQAPRKRQRRRGRRGRRRGSRKFVSSILKRPDAGADPAAGMDVDASDKSFPSIDPVTAAK